MTDLAEEYKDREVVYCAVNLREDTDTIKGFLKTLNWNIQVPLDERGEIAEKFGVEGIPTVILVDKHMGERGWGEVRRPLQPLPLSPLHRMERGLKGEEAARRGFGSRRVIGSPFCGGCCWLRAIAGKSDQHGDFLECYLTGPP